LGEGLVDKKEKAMGRKKVLAVGCEFGGGEAEYVPLSSNRSLLDGDIVLFEPSLGDADCEKRYNGKPLGCDRHSALKMGGLENIGGHILQEIPVFLAIPDKGIRQS